MEILNIFKEYLGKQNNIYILNYENLHMRRKT